MAACLRVCLVVPAKLRPVLAFGESVMYVMSAALREFGSAVRLPV
jgi:hypothetical protein